MKNSFIILFFVACSSTPNANRSVESIAATAIDPEMNALKIRVTKLENENAVLKKADSTNKAQDKIEAAKQNDLAIRYSKDSGKHWAAIRNEQARVIPNLQPLALRFIKDSIITRNELAKQLIEINKLKSASPVTQIPVMQAQITAVKNQLNTAQAYAFTEIGKNRIKTDSLQTLIKDHSVVPDSTQMKVTSGVMRIPVLDTLQSRVTILWGLKPPGGQRQ